MAMSLPRTARKSLRLPSSWATEINFQSRNPGGILIPKMGAASSSARLAANVIKAMAQTAVATITKTDIGFIEPPFIEQWFNFFAPPTLCAERNKQTRDRHKGWGALRSHQRRSGKT